ncbi:MauE/DoxX family redox-associated membrane protein [Flavobacterium agrisoli]|uniref:Methylamine utilisation protein MauE domain-containing protein n=1 Tax=Flavobacterium agrisoli TaxID=2793066 RepID=A0A934PKW5_9FLAO|nr:MauE/DoxX family redox-associated membrane protein [Flavobacterium agrisoli]MBK0368630.1 hypothetical protein [Flavobacterium agrisoli]
MNSRSRFKNYFIEAVSLFYILLFVYAAISKVLEFENFQAQLGQSSIIGAYAGIVSYSIITIELAVSLMLVIPSFKLKGLYITFILMSLFTVYIFIILNFTSNIPCSCGGILENMTWKAHLIFNIISLILAGLAILFFDGAGRRTKLNLGAIFLSAVFTLVMLNISSQYLIQKENPFIRKYVHMSCNKASATVLYSKNLYFAGSDKRTIYLADRLAPLYITAYDTALKIRKNFKIELKDDKYPFRSVQVKIAPPYFFLLDGTVPIIYRGKISNWKAEVLMKESGYYFSNAAVIDSVHIAFRTQGEKSGENILGIFSFKNGLQSSIKDNLLEKQIDGFFDTDGMMNYSVESKIFTYLYYYRNEFIVTDDQLQLKFRGNTIDTNKTAKLKPVFIKEMGRRKLASPDYVVNRLSTVRKNQLFVNSTLPGRYEDKQMWKTTSIIDVYDLSTKSYISSVYIYNANDGRMRDMLVLDNNVYVIAGTELSRYALQRNLKIKL